MSYIIHRQYFGKIDLGKLDEQDFIDMNDFGVEIDDNRAFDTSYHFKYRSDSKNPKQAELIIDALIQKIKPRIRIG